jgi:glyoxylase-like metal-dependent hydrolase (beta-lactamase superfamily II)
VRVRSRGALALITGDVFNHPIQLPHPEWPSGTDSDPATATRTRRAILAQLASEPGTPIAPSHFAEPFGEARLDAGGKHMWRSR